MAQPFFRFHNAAQRALPKYPGTRIQYIRGQGYRLVPVKPAAPNPKTATKQGLPEYVPPTAGPIMEQANTQAKGIYEPILQMIAQRQERERQEAIARQQASVAGATQAYAAAEQPMADLYNRAVGQATTVEQAVADRLKGIGGERSADLANRLTQMGAPTGAQDLTQTYQGASGAGFASGMSDVGRLISRGTEQQAALKRGPLDFRRQSEGELSEALLELTKMYGGQREEILANVPQQVQDIFEKLFGQAEDRNKSIYDDRWARIKYLDERKQAAMEAMIVAKEMGDKKAYQEALLLQKDLDRQQKLYIAQMNEEGRNTRDNPAPVASGPNMKFNPDGTPNPNYKPPTAKGGETPAQWRIREQEANKQIRNILLRKDSGGRQTQQPSQFVTNASNAQVNQRINAVLRQNKIDPNSPRGIRLRKAAWASIGVQTGPNGNPVVGSRKKPGVGA